MANTWQIHEFEGEVTVRQFEADSVRVFGMLRCSAMVVWNGSSKAGEIVRTSKRQDFTASRLKLLYAIDRACNSLGDLKKPRRVNDGSTTDGRNTTQTSLLSCRRPLRSRAALRSDEGSEVQTLNWDAFFQHKKAEHGDKTIQFNVKHWKRMKERSMGGKLWICMNPLSLTFG